MILPEKNADGLAAWTLTDEQKYRFDTHGWLLLPAVLTASEIEEMRDFCYRLHRDGASLPPHQRSTIAGPLETLIDHPAILGFMNPFVADPYAGSEYGYGFRLENSFLALRGKGHNNFNPHGGSGLLSFGYNSHLYRCLPGAVFSGLTRAVWELNPVRRGDGGTLLLSGSHKAAFEPPASIQDPHSPLWEEYDCPAGSLLLFTEALTHSGALWTNPDTERVAIFNCYNTLGSKWHNWNPTPEVLAELHPMRRTLFRGVHCDQNTVAADGNPR